MSRRPPTPALSATKVDLMVGETRWKGTVRRGDGTDGVFGPPDAGRRPAHEGRPLHNTSPHRGGAPRLARHAGEARRRPPRRRHRVQLEHWTTWPAAGPGHPLADGLRPGAAGAAHGPTGPGWGRRLRRFGITGLRRDRRRAEDGWWAPAGSRTLTGHHVGRPEVDSAQIPSAAARFPGRYAGRRLNKKGYYPVSFVERGSRPRRRLEDSSPAPAGPAQAGRSCDPGTRPRRSRDISDTRKRSRSQNPGTAPRADHLIAGRPRARDPRPGGASRATRRAPSPSLSPPARFRGKPLALAQRTNAPRKRGQ